MSVYLVNLKVLSGFHAPLHVVTFIGIAFRSGLPYNICARLIFEVSSAVHCNLIISNLRQI